MYIPGLVMVILLTPPGLLLVLICLYFLFKRENSSIIRWLYLFCSISFIGFSLIINYWIHFNPNGNKLIQTTYFILFYLGISLLVIISIIKIIKFFMKKSKKIRNE